MKGFKSTSTNPYTYTQSGVWKKGQYTFQAVVLSDSGYAFAFQRSDTTWQTVDLSWQVKNGSYSKIQWTFTLEVDAVAFRLIANTVTGETIVLQPMLEKGSNGSTPIAHEEDLRGMDGDNHEFIFTRNTTGIAPDAPLSTQDDDYVPEDWTDNAQGVTSGIPFEFVSMRERKNGVWLDFSPPSLWAKWGEDGLSVNLLVEGHYNSHWEGVTKVVEIVGGVDVGGNEVVKVSAVFRKGEENIAATVSQSRGFQWYVNGVHLTAFDNQPFITLDETYGDGFADYVVLSYLVNSIREEERREIINISEGMDGIGEEFIFKANNSDTTPPVLPQTTDVGYQNDDYHGDWSDDPVAPTKMNQFVWAAKRKKIGGIWEAFGAPSIWTRWVADGVSITLVDVEFAKNTTPATPPAQGDSGWTTTAPTLTGTEQLWTRTKTAYSSGSPTYSTPANITPKTGAAGQGIDSVTEEYHISSSKTTQPAEGSVGWSTTQPTWSQGQYIWSRVKVVYKNPSSTIYTGYAVSSEWEAINNLEIGGRNLIIGSFNDWRSITVGQYGSQLGFITIQDDWRGKTVTHSVEVKDIPIGESVQIRVDFFRPDNTYTATGFGNIVSLAGKLFLNYTVPTDTQFNRIRARISPLSYTSDYNVLFRGEKLEFGNKATDWTPAPEDVEANIETAKTEAENAAKAYANTKSEAERVIAEAYADGIVTAEEQARIDDVNNKLAAAKAYADAQDALLKAQQEAYADGKISTAEQAAIQAAKDYADLKKTEAQAYADGIVSDEEARAIADALAKYNAAKAHAEQIVEDIEIGGRNLASRDKFNITGVGSFNETSNTWVLNPKAVNHGIKLSLEGINQNEDYVLTYYIKYVSGELNNFGGHGNSITTKKLLLDDVRVSGSIHGGLNKSLIEDGLWHKVNIYFEQRTIPAISNVIGIELNRYASAPFDSVFEVKDIKLEKGNKATDWTPAPEDVQAEIDAAVVKATYWSVKASAPVIYKDAINAATSGVHTPVTISGELRSGTTTTSGGFITVTPNGGTEGTATASPVTIAPANGDGKTSYTVRLYDTASKTTLLDTQTIPVVFKGASGVNAISAVLSNEADVLPATAGGTVIDYTGSGTTIRVFEGSQELSYGTGNGKYQVSASGSGITVGSVSTSGNTRVYGVASNMTADNATITFTISGKTADGVSFSFTKTQSFSKSRTGASAPLLYLSASSLTMACYSTNVAKTGQTITINAKLQNVTGVASFDATPYNDAGTALTKITLGGSGNTKTLTSSQWLSTFQKVAITATLNGLSDSVTITRLPDGGDGEPAKSIHLNPSAKAISITEGNTPVPTSVTVTGAAVNTTIQYWYYSADGATSFTGTPPTGVTRSGNQVTINSATAKFKTLSIKARNSTDDVEDVVTITRGGGAPYVDETTNTWWEWDEELGIYTDTGMSPVGSDGRIPYPAGYWEAKTYTRDADYAPYVQHTTAVYLLVEDSALSTDVPGTSNKWKAFNNWQAVFVDSLVAKFAQIGGAVFTGNTDPSSTIRGRLISEMGVDGTVNFQNYTGDSGAWQPKLMLDFLNGMAKIEGEIKATSGKIGDLSIDNGKLLVGDVGGNRIELDPYNRRIRLINSAEQLMGQIVFASGDANRSVGAIMELNYLYQNVKRSSIRIGGFDSDVTIRTYNTSGVEVGETNYRHDGMYIDGQKVDMGGGGGSGYVLPTASQTTLGGVKIGSNISISNGVISVAAPYTHPSTHPASMISAGTLGGIVKANNNASYTTKQVRNMILSTGDADSSQMENGDIWIKYV